MRFYRINTDRGAIDSDRKAKGLSTCDLWIAYRMAFAGDKPENREKHANLFKKVHEDDILFMHHSKPKNVRPGDVKFGYVGVGVVLSTWDKEVYEGDDRLLYTEDMLEYRVPVRWQDFRHSPLPYGDGLPRPTPSTWQEIDEQRFPSVRSYASGASIESIAEYEKKLTEAIASSLRDSAEARGRRLATPQAKPRVLTVLTTVYERNPDVVAEVLKRADGVCERCGKPAPFARRSDGTPYLEVHHIQQLASGGSDTETNAQALCPNCHRRTHYGVEET